MVISVVACDDENPVIASPPEVFSGRWVGTVVFASGDELPVSLVLISSSSGVLGTIHERSASNALWGFINSVAGTQERRFWVRREGCRGTLNGSAVVTAAGFELELEGEDCTGPVSATLFATPA